MARSTMTELISQLRVMTEASASTETVNGVLYWTDDQLQSILDRHSTYWNRLALVPLRAVAAGNVAQYRIYPFPLEVGQWIERDGNTLALSIQDSNGNIILVGAGDDDISIDYDKRQVVFNSDTSGQIYYMTATSYNLYAAAAEVWQTKASLRTSLIDWRSDNHSLKEDQEYQHCMEQYTLYSGKAANGFQATRFVRVDEAYDYGYFNSISIDPYASAGFGALT